jgi:hypothetical protein
MDTVHVSRGVICSVRLVVKKKKKKKKGGREGDEYLNGANMLSKYSEQPC